jgi:hypothetical protein
LGGRPIATAVGWNRKAGNCLCEGCPSNIPISLGVAGSRSAERPAIPGPLPNKFPDPT